MAYDSQPQSTLGAIEIGQLISSILFGILTTQLYHYHMSSFKDPTWVKFGLIGGIWFIELVHTICVFHIIYFFSVLHYGDPASFDTWPTSLSVSIVCNGLVTILVQGFFIYRIIRFTEGRSCCTRFIVPIICWVLTIFQFVCDIVLSSEAGLGEKNFPKFQRRWRWMILAALSARAASDLLIAGTLVYHLIYDRKSSAYKNTIAVIDKLIRWTVETGIITSVFSISIMTCYLTMAGNYAWLAIYMILPKVFSNAMLANMNSRTRLRKRMSEAVVSSLSQETISTDPVKNPVGPLQFASIDSFIASSSDKQSSVV